MTTSNLPKESFDDFHFRKWQEESAQAWFDGYDSYFTRRGYKNFSNDEMSVWLACSFAGPFKTKHFRDEFEAGVRQGMEDCSKLSLTSDR